jgi:hypothetical protein
MTVGNMSPNWARVVHHGMYELSIQHLSLPDALIQKQTEYPETLRCFTSNLIYVTRPGKSPIQGNPQIFDFFFLSNLFTEKPEWTRWQNVSSRNEYGCTFIDIDHNPPVSKPYFQISQMSLQIFYQV